MPATQKPQKTGQNAPLSLKSASNHGKSAGRSYLARIKDSGHWMLLAQGGAITLPHEDAFGDDTYLVNYAGNVGFGWISRPTSEERKRFSHNLSVPLEKALDPKTTIDPKKEELIETR